jgi:mono/diheme cytochrome c family protein
MRKSIVGVALVAILSACGGGGDEEAPAVSREEALRAARADSVARAEEMYDASVFDTLTWESDNARWERGGVVWSFTCQRCHGADGKGQGEDAVKFGFSVPDITVPDWQYAGDIPGIRHVIFVGHDTEMPSMGVIGLGYADADAAAHYIDDLLRSPD